mmetsp:Transcript_21638/g.52253  ORF Transcript_21638/g.52253 Transcript_21638/m.52253 type:complete len:284 (-) Transcript_21638:284-1135(-)
MGRVSHSSRRSILRCAVAFLLTLQQVLAWSSCNSHIYQPRRRHVQSSPAKYPSSTSPPEDDESLAPSLRSLSRRQSSVLNRRDGIRRIIQSTATLATAVVQTQIISTIQPAAAYTPDADPLRESLYLMSRVQEATVQQERFVNRAARQDALKGKMKLTLRLVEKNYRLLDQITFASEYVTPSSKVVEATTAGYEAAEALQNAIDYVNYDLSTGEFEKGQKEYLTSNLGECRERLFDFLSYMPKDALEGARKRVEEENVANRDEFDGDSDAGVYNPVMLPWKNR